MSLAVLMFNPSDVRYMQIKKQNVELLKTLL